MKSYTIIKSISKTLVACAIFLVAVSAIIFGVKNSKISADTIRCGIPVYKQTDSSWASISYGKDEHGNTATIKSSGCGPTSLAMVMSAWGHHMSPADAASYCLSNGYRINGGGTDPGCFAAMAAKYGMGIEKQTDRQTVKNYLTNGYPAIVSVGPGSDGKYTSGGHYIVLDRLDGSTVTINDPNKNNTSDSFSNIYDTYKKNGFWFLYNPT